MDSTPNRSTFRRLLVGTREATNPALLAGGYVGCLLALYLVGVAVGTLQSGTPTLADPVAEPLLFPVAFLWGPPVVGAVHALRGGGVDGAIAVGIGVGVGFFVLGVAGHVLGTGGNGDSPLWALSLLFAASGTLGAVVGYAVGAVARELLARRTQS